jgi:hypothetical protein
MKNSEREHSTTAFELTALSADIHVDKCAVDAFF